MRSRAPISGMGLLGLLLALPPDPAPAQSQERKLPPIQIPSPFKLEFSQRFNPYDALGKTAMERFKLSAGAAAWQLQYANQAPSILSSRQTQAAPSNYDMVEFLVKRKWGTLSAFRSTGSKSRSIAPAAERRFSGFGFEVPKSWLGLKLSSYLLHASPGGRARSSGSPASRRGTQLLLGTSRDFKKGFKWRAELSRSWQPLSGEARDAAAGGGLYSRLEGPVAKTDLNLSFRRQDEPHTSVLTPARGRGRNLLTLDLRRKVRSHQFHYTSQIDAVSALRALRGPPSVLNQNAVRWTYAPKRLPQISAMQTWTAQSAPAKRESGENLQIALNKGLKRFTLGFTYLRAMRADDLNLRHLWERVSMTGDASFEFLKGRRINLRYETGELALLPASTVISTSSLQLQTRLSYFGDRLAFSPVFDLRRQEDSRAGRDSSILSCVLSALLKLPRYFPGTDVMITISTRRMASMGMLQQRTQGFVVQWNFKRT